MSPGCRGWVPTALRQAWDRAHSSYSLKGRPSFDRRSCRETPWGRRQGENHVTHGGVCLPRDLSCRSAGKRPHVHTSPVLGGCGDGTPCTAGGREGAAAWETAWAPQNIENRAAIGPGNLLLGSDPRELRAGSGTGLCTPMFMAASFIRGERWEPPRAWMEDTVPSGAAGPQVSESRVNCFMVTTLST